MVRVEVARGRARLTEGPDGLEITIPARRNVGLILFFGVWLMVWAAGEVFVAVSYFGIVKAPPPFGTFFVIVCLGLLTAGGLLVLYTWLWMLVGKQRIRMNETTLTIKNDVLGVGREREFDTPHVAHLRVAEPPISRDWFGRRRLSIPTPGRIAFDYGAKTYRFGLSIGEEEAKALVQQIKDRYKVRDTRGGK